MILAELSEKRDRIVVTFPYAPDTVAKVKKVQGRSFVPKDRGGPHWTVPLDMPSGRALREQFGDQLTLGPNLLAWGRERRKHEEGLVHLGTTDAIEASELAISTKMPELAEWFRPYQLADVAYLSRANAINANEQGLGKTTEIIGAIYEADLEAGPHLVAAPVTSIEVVWAAELERWQKIPVLAAEDPFMRAANIKKAHKLYEAGEPFWLVINPDMVRFSAIKEPDHDGKMREVAVEMKYPELFDIIWNTVTVDEFHKVGLNNMKTLTSRAFYALNAKRRYCMSGTPMGGKPIKLFGALKFIEPEAHTSKWRWAGTWLEVTDGYGTSKEIGGILKGKEDEFYKHHAQYMLRRLKSEVLPQLPPKQYVDVWCKMSPKQAKQYNTFAKEAEIRIDEQMLSATGILAEYARLKSFATAYCEIDGREVRCSACQGTGEDAWGRGCEKCGGEGITERLKLKPTFDSAKLPYLMDRLAEVGIDPADPEGEEVAVIGSQSVETCEMVHRYLNEKGVHAEIITGKTVKPGERRRLIEAFQAGQARVMVLSTKAGGVAITLDRANTVHILDETWVPDDQEQLEDRVHRASRIHQVTCYYYRTKDTIEEYIYGVTQEKAFTNADVLDLRRQGFRATKGA